MKTQSQNIKIQLETEDSILMVDVNQLLYCEKVGSRIDFHFIQYIEKQIPTTFRNIEQTLSCMWRIHPSIMVNLNKIEHITNHQSDNTIQLINGLTLPIEPMRKKLLLSKLIEMATSNKFKNLKI